MSKVRIDQARAILKERGYVLYNSSVLPYERRFSSKKATRGGRLAFTGVYVFVSKDSGLLTVYLAENDIAGCVSNKIVRHFKRDLYEVWYFVSEYSNHFHREQGALVEYHRCMAKMYEVSIMDKYVIHNK